MATSNKINNAANGDSTAGSISPVVVRPERDEVGSFEVREMPHGAPSFKTVEDLYRSVEETLWYVGYDRRFVSPRCLVFDLTQRRPEGYEFFGTQTEGYQSDPEIAKAEKALRTLVATAIEPTAVDRNRSELEGWGFMTRGWSPDHPRPKLKPSSRHLAPEPLSRDELLWRVNMVLAYAGIETISMDEPHPIWDVFAADPEYRSIQRKRFELDADGE